MRSRDLRWRLWLPMLLVVLLGNLGIGWHISRASQHVQSAALERELLRSASLLAGAASKGSWEFSAALAKENPTLSEAYVVMTDPSGNLIFQHPSANVRFGAGRSWPDLQKTLTYGSTVFVRAFSPLAEKPLLFCTMPAVSQDGQIIGAVSVALPQQEQELAAAQHQMRLVLAGITAGSLLLALAFSYWLTTWLSKNIRSLAECIGRSTLYPERQPPPISRVFAPIWLAWGRAVRQFRESFQTLTDEVSQLRAGLEYLTDGIIVVDRQGKVLLMNPAVRKLLNISEEAPDMPFVQLVRDYRIMDLWRRAYDSPESQPAAAPALEIRRENTHLLVSAIRIPPISSSGSKDVCLLMIQDISEARRLEAVRREFISNISHELRTPLASLKALVETLREGALEDPPAARRFLEHMEVEVDDLSQLVQELLDLSRLESGQVVLHPRPIHPAKIIEPVVGRFRPLAERAGITLSSDIPQHLPPIEADVSLLQRVMTNLLHNAIKFTPAGGTIHIASWDSANEVIISIRDTGVGIAQKDLPHIFERFYKADRSRAGGGTGLGLAIAKHAVLLHGGRIWAESQEGRGSTFYFAIPKAPI